MQFIGKKQLILTAIFPTFNAKALSIMKLTKYALLLLSSLFFVNIVSAQYTETFESFSAGGTSFTSNGQTFAITGGYAFYNFSQGGWSGSAKDNIFIDNTTASGQFCTPKLTTSIKTTNAAAFTIKSIYAFTATCSGLNQNVSGTMVITGKLGGNQVFTYTKNSGFTINTSTNNGFTLLDFTNLGNSVDNSTKGIDEIEFVIGGSFGYLALDAFRWQSGIVPTITTSGTPAALSTCAGTASATQNFSVSGSNLTANIVATAPTGFEVSTAAGSGFGSSVTLTQSGGNVSSTTVYVRLASSATGTPSGTVDLTTTGGVTKTVAVSGTVNSLPTFSLGSVSNVLTNATSFSLPYSAVTASPNQYSITTGSPTAMGSFAAVSNASLGGSPLSVTIPASLGNTYNFNMTMRNSTTGCVSAAVPFTLTVISPSIVTTGSFSAFSSCAGTASAAQSINVSGSNLIANISVAAPTGFEISTAVGSGYGSSVTLTQSSNAVSSTPVYVRLAAAASGTPSGNVAASSTNGTTQNVSVSGTMNALPTITIGTVAGVSTSATSFSIPFSNTTGSPTQYSLSAGTPAMPSFAAVSNATLPATPIGVTIPASAANTYGFGLTVKNTTTGCVSSNVPVSLTVATPVITVTGSFSAFTVCSGLASTAQSVSVSGSNLAGNVTVTAPTGFEVSTAAGSGYGSSVALSPSSGTLGSTAVYARIAAGTTGTPSGNVSCTATGATTQNKAVSGTVNTTAAINNAATASTCSGSSPNITLSANVSSTYTWTLGTNTGSITGASASTGSPTAINQSLTNPSTTAAGSIVYIVVPTSVTGSCVGSAFNITVTVNPLTAVTADPSATSACAGGNASFTVGATGNNLSYQWQVNQGSGYADIPAAAPYSNVTQPTMNITGAVVGMNGYTYRCVVSGNCPAAISNGAPLTVAHIWLGNSAVWTAGTNWSCGSAPVASSNVIIPAGTNFSPAITSTVTLNQLTINSGASLSNTGSNRIFTLNGTLINNGTLSIGSNNLVLNSSVSGTGTLSSTAGSTVTVGGNVGTLRFTPATNNLLNLVLNDNTSATLGNAVNIVGGSNSGAVSVGLNAVLTTGGFLTLRSNATGTAAIDMVQAGGAITGNVTVERYIPAGKRGFRLLSPGVTTTNFIKANWQEGATSSTANPVAGYGTHITGSTVDQTNGFDGTITGNASLYKLNNATQLWGNIANTNATNLVAGNAYRLLIRGNRAVDLTAAALPNTATTLRATGALTTGSVTFGSGGSTPASLPTLASGAGLYSFIGNPYAAAIDWNALTRTELTGYYWIWDPTLATSGAYVSCFTDGTTSNGSSAVTTTIQPGQAFFVVNSSNAAARSLVIAEENKILGNTTNVFRTQAGTSTMGIQLFLTSNINSTSQDGANILFNNAFNNAVNDDDAGKFTNIDENIAVQRGSSLMSIERRNVPANPNDTVFLKAWQLTQNSYTLRIASNNFDATMSAYLQDSYLNSETQLNLAGTTDVHFSTTAVAASMAANRFRIVFRSNGALPVSITGLKAFQQNAGVQVEWKTVNETNMAAYEVEKSVDGAVFSKAGKVAATGSSTYNWYDASPVNGSNYYRIKLLDKNGTFNYTQVVNVKIGGIKNTFTIVGNPVKNRVVALQMENVEKGSYTVQVFNNLGQTIASKTINHAGGSATETIALGNAAAGTYQLSIVGSNVKETKTIVVE